MTKVLDMLTATYQSAEGSQMHFIARDVPTAAVIDMLAEYRLEDPRDTALFTGMLVTLGDRYRAFWRCSQCSAPTA